MRWPKGCIAKGYAMEKSMGLLMEYMQNFTLVSRRVWDVEEEESVSGEVLEGADRSVYLSPTIRDIAHHYVLTNTTTMAWWIK